MLELIEFDLILYMIPVIAFILGYCFTDSFASSKTINSEDEMPSHGSEIFAMNKQIIHNLGFFTN